MLADRLSEDGRNTVLVLEYGGSDRSLWIQMPTALSIPMNMERYDWRYYTEPEPNLNNRRLHTPRGKVLGGSSSINGLVYVRGNAQDFERWESQGASGWSYAEVLPYFRRAERRAGGGDEYRGDSGKLATRGGLADQPAARGVAGGRAPGRIPAAAADMNGRQQEGFATMDMTVGEGRRCSAANAYLRPAMRRPNLACARTRWRRAYSSRGAARSGCAMSVGGALNEVRARREVIVSAGPDQFTAAAEALRSRAGRGAR